MLGTISVLSLVCGVAVACAADYAPAHAAAFERCGGGLLIVGLTLIGLALGETFPIAS